MMAELAGSARTESILDMIARATLEAEASARGRRVERVLCARLLNEEVRRLQLGGQREAALAVRRVVQMLARRDGD